MTKLFQSERRLSGFDTTAYRTFNQPTKKNACKSGFRLLTLKCKVLSS